MPPHEVQVVDDDAGSLNSTAFLLQTAGFEVRAYCSATAFLRDFRVGGAGVLLTDLRMPEIDGLQLLRRVRADGDRRPILVMTGHADAAIVREVIAAGANRLLEKPFRPDELVSAIEAAFA